MEWILTKPKTASNCMLIHILTKSYLATAGSIPLRKCIINQYQCNPTVHILIILSLAHLQLQNPIKYLCNMTWASTMQAIGELLYAMVTCRVGSAFPVIKLSQYAINPSKLQYEAVKNIFYYLNRTREHGLIYWRTTSVTTLPR